MANISTDKEFIKEILGEGMVSNGLFGGKSSFIRIPSILIMKDEKQNSDGEMPRFFRKFDDKVKTIGFSRITKLFNLISSKNPKIVEQVAIILANASSSDKDFSQSFISDLCMKNMIRIIDKPNLEVLELIGITPSFDYTSESSTLLAILITILNFSSSNQQEILKGLEFLGIMRILENLIRNENIPLIVKSVALLIISNVSTNHRKYPPKIS